MCFPNSALKDAKTRCEQTLASCHKLLEASSVVVLAEHETVMGAINSLCSQVDTQPLTPLIKPTIHYTIPMASDLLDDILDKISVSLCGEEEKREETRRQDSSVCVSQPEERDELGEMYEGNLSMKKAAVYSSRRICAGGSLSRRPLGWTSKKDVGLSVNQQPKPKSVSTACVASYTYGDKDVEPTSFVCEASGSDNEQESTFNLQEHLLYTPPSDDEEF